MKTANILAIALLNGAFVALPASSASAQEAAEITVEGSKAERKSCRREGVVGSNFQKRICLTQEQWKARDRAEEDYKSRVMHGQDSQATQMKLQIEPSGGGG